MAGRTIGFLDSYDILGKAIPGIVLLFGILFTLPTSVFANAQTPINIKSLAAIFVASAIAGVVFGEGVHTLAILAERTLAWLTKRATAIYRIFYQILAFVWKGLSPSHQESGSTEETEVDRGVARSDSPASSSEDEGEVTEQSTEDEEGEVTEDEEGEVTEDEEGEVTEDEEGEVTEDEEGGENDKSVFAQIGRWFISLILYQFPFTDDTELEQLRPIGVSSRSRTGLIEAFRMFGDAFVPHRTLFTRFVSERATYTRGEGPGDIRFRHFRDAVTDYYDLPADAFFKAGTLYPLLVSHLDASSVNRSRRFQGRYSFTRGMWLSTGLLSILYFSIYCSAYADEIQPGLRDTFNGMPILSLQLTVSAAIFLFLWLLASSGIQRAIEWITNKSTGVFIPWILGGIVILISQNPISNFTHQFSLYTWDWIHQALLVFLTVALEIGQVVQFLAGVESMTEIYATTAFENSLLALSILLAISSFAFIISTGSYKRYYVEYLVIDAWESLEGGTPQRLSLSVDSETLEDFGAVIELDSENPRKSHDDYWDRRRGG